MAACADERYVKVASVRFSKGIDLSRAKKDRSINSR